MISLTDAVPLEKASSMGSAGSPSHPSSGESAGERMALGPRRLFT
ncbi:hypothetical protein B0G71_0093 [Paraburkholderia sp. BL27I4N3]|nr:hypothetical protein B0G71_0093 [Paraburkholderia sp. BL27I4N3]